MTDFTPIDLQAWERGQHFYYYANIAKTGYTVSVEIDITNLLNEVKQMGIKFYPSYLYAATACLNQMKEFKIAYQNEVLGYWTALSPIYPIFHDDDKTTSLMWTEYDENFSVFYNRYLSDAKQYGQNHGLLAKPDPPPNCYIVSSIPWISFSSFSVHNYGEFNYYLPSIEAGKYYEKDNKTLLPLSVTIHHASADGYHIHMFLKNLEQLCSHPEQWL